MDILFTIGAAHGFLVFLTAIGVIYSDHQGFLYFKGKKETLSPAFVKLSHRIVWIGLILIITTGAALTIPAWEYRLSEGAFYLKMGFVLVLLMNAFAIGKLSKKATAVAFKDLAQDEKKTLLVSGALSVMGWVSAATIGLLFL